MQTCRRQYPGGIAEVFRSTHILSATAAFPVPLTGRLPHYPFRGLRGVHSRCGLPARGVAQGNPLHRRLRRLRYLHRRSDCYRPERNLAGRELHPLKTHAFHGAQRGREAGGMGVAKLERRLVSPFNPIRTLLEGIARGRARNRHRRHLSQILAHGARGASKVSFRQATHAGGHD